MGGWGLNASVAEDTTMSAHTYKKKSPRPVHMLLGAACMANGWVRLAVQFMCACAHFV